MADGGGGGGGGGGQWGGRGGATVGGDDGAHSGSNGGSVVPTGFTSSAGSNSPSTPGYITITYTADRQLFYGGQITTDGTTWTHTYGPNVTGYPQYLVPNYPDSYTPIVKGFTNVNGVWKQFFPSSGSEIWDTPGDYTWKVPMGIERLTINAGGGGGGGGGAGAGGFGAGGGSGGVAQKRIMNVIPGEILQIKVGAGGGAGAPTAQGSPGGSTLIIGELDQVILGGGGGGEGYKPPPPPPAGGGGGCKIICTKLFELGYLSETIYEADERFGEYLRATDPYAYYGYVKWASVVVDWMEKDGPQCMFWIRDKDRRNTAQKEMAISWARRIATPWAEHMAYTMGVGEKDNRAGRLIMKTGMWVSRMIGKYTKTTEPTKNVALGYIMWLTFGIFWLLAGVK